MLSLPNAPDPKLSHVDVVTALIRGLQHPDLPKPRSGGARLHEFATVECRATLTRRRRAPDGRGSYHLDPERFAQSALLGALPGCVSFRILGESTVIPPTETRGALATVVVAVEEAGNGFRFRSGFERTRSRPRKPAAMPEEEAPPEHPVERYQFTLYQERRPPHLGCWLVKSIVPVTEMA